MAYYYYNSVPADEKFQVNFIFENFKNPAEAFSKLSEIFDSLTNLDKLFLASIDSQLEFDYALQSLEFSSIKTWITQGIREIPDEAIKEFDWKKLVGHFLIKLKYLVLRYLEENHNIDSQQSIVRLSAQIESEKKLVLKNDNQIITEINHYMLLNALEQIVQVLKRLKDDEKIEYKSEDGTAKVGNSILFNKAKILWEFGDQKFDNETTEVLKIKKLDLLSNTPSWNFKFNNKSIDARVTDQEWLDRYHQREFPLLPEDSLKVKLKIGYINKPDGSISKPNYEITKVIDIIYPQNNQTNLPLNS